MLQYGYIATHYANGLFTAGSMGLVIFVTGCHKSFGWQLGRRYYPIILDLDYH